MTPVTPSSFDTDAFLEDISIIDKSKIDNELDRRRVVAGVQDLLARLQSPREKTTQLLHTNSYVVAAVKSLVNLRLFDVWKQHGAEPETAGRLAALTGADPILLERLLRLLTASGMISIDNDGLHAFGEFAQGMTAGRLSHSWMLHSMTTANSVVALPKFLSDNNYRNPTSSKDSPWAYHMSMPFIQYLNAHPTIFSHLNEVMKNKNENTVPWFAAYPINRVLKDCITGGVALVDIGGGTGHDVNALLQHMLSLGCSCRLVLQDLPNVIDEAVELPSSIERQPYDFFTEQPVEGARIYYMHNVLHDWADEECYRILTRARDAMERGYSRLLINETVLTRSSSPTACATDLSMMTVNGGGERTMEQWHHLLSVSGFRVTQLYVSAAIDEGLIEVEMTEDAKVD